MEQKIKFDEWYKKVCFEAIQFEQFVKLIKPNPNTTYELLYKQFKMIIK